MFDGKLNKDGQPTGKGTLTLVEGEMFMGTFKNGVLNGKGKSINPIRGDVYEGSFKDMLRHGKGKLYIEE